MKKRIFIGIFTLILVALCEMAAFAAAPYSSNLDSLSSSSDNLDVLSQEQTILDMMAFSDEAQPYAAASLDFSKAQKQYIMNSVSFYDILSLSPSSAEAFVKDDYAWTVPLEETDENYEYHKSVFFTREPSPLAPDLDEPSIYLKRCNRAACIQRMQNTRGLGTAQQAFCNAKMAFV